MRADEPGRMRGGAYAVDPGEPLLAVNVASSLMPLAGRGARSAHRWALAIGLLVAAVSAAVGLLPFALAVATITVPVVYVVYLYDVNEWEDQPIPVLLATVVLAGALAVGFTLLWQNVILDGANRSPIIGFGYDVDWDVLLVVGVLVPAGVLVLSQLGPLWLVARRGFEDLIDGLTFGIAAGATFAMVETFVLAYELIFRGPGRVDSPDAAVWVSLIVIAGLIKPIVYGSAVGIAVASFSGLGERCEGFTARYARGLLEAFAALVAFRVGLYLTGQLGGSLAIFLGLAWGLIVGVWLILRIRMLLQTALLESALTAETAGAVPATAAHGIAFCGECEMPLVDSASFCVVCGASVRAASKPIRESNAAGGAGRSDVTWSGTRPASARTSTGVLVVVGLLVIGLTGALIAAINTGTRREPSKNIEVATSSGRALSRAIPTGLGPSGGGEEGSEEGSVVGPLGVTVAVPEGWHVEEVSDLFVWLLPDDGDGAYALVDVFTPEEQSPAAQWLQGYAVEQRISWLQEIDGTITVVPEDELQPGVVEYAHAFYTAIHVQNDGTAAPFEGWVGVLKTNGGSIVVTYYGNYQGEWNANSPAYDEINLSVNNSLPD